jgi:hypothetical protein
MQGGGRLVSFYGGLAAAAAHHDTCRVGLSTEGIWTDMKKPQVVLFVDDWTNSTSSPRDQVVLHFTELPHHSTTATVRGAASPLRQLSQALHTSPSCSPYLVPPQKK